MPTPLTDAEEKVLIEALNILETQFEEDAQAEVIDSDSEEYVDIEVKFSDGTYESMAVERSKLSDGSSPKEVAGWFY